MNNLTEAKNTLATCRNMQDHNCCAHNCDYNDLVDALNALKAERDALASQVDALFELLIPAAKLMRATAQNSGWHEKARNIESLISEMQDKRV